eukprot:9611133-Heterocapsa_arctica.AAC.1
MPRSMEGRMLTGSKTGKLRKRCTTRRWERYCAKVSPLEKTVDHDRRHVKLMEKCRWYGKFRSMKRVYELIPDQ